jgi:AraC-like DNA-binding protein
MQAAELVEEYISAWNRRDPAAILGMMTNNGFYFDIPSNEKVSGQALVQYLSNDFSQRQFHYAMVGEIMIGDHTIAFQYRTHILDDLSDGGDELQGAEFLTVRGDKVTGIEDYYKFPSESRMQYVAKSGDMADATTKYRKSGMRPEQQLAYRQDLLSLMEDERLYLSPDLTLPELARRMNCSINHLSQVINDGLQVSFYQFLNRYRIEAAKALLVGTPARQYPIGDVARRAGFNSTSAFYVAFRRLCGQTPSDYRRQMRGN